MIRLSPNIKERSCCELYTRAPCAARAWIHTESDDAFSSIFVNKSLTKENSPCSAGFKMVQDWRPRFPVNFETTEGG